MRVVFEIRRPFRGSARVVFEIRRPFRGSVRVIFKIRCPFRGSARVVFEIRRPFRGSEWSFACCNNPFGGQNGLLHVATTYSVSRMVFYMLQQPIRWAEWAFTWLQHNFVRVQTSVASLGRPFRCGRTVVSLTFRACVISRWNDRGTTRILFYLRWD